jgi:tetratricopeptide (TPR) repeat protein
VIDYLVWIEGVEPDRTIGLGIDVLQQTLAVVPGLLEAQLLLARTKYLTNDLPGAQATINACLQLDPNYSAANVLLAQIHLGEEQYPEALGALEQALAHDFVSVTTTSQPPQLDIEEEGGVS